MRKFYMFMLAVLCIAGTAMAERLLANATSSDEASQTVGTYALTIQPTTINGETQPAVGIQVEVRTNGDNYWMTEVGTTNYFDGKKVPFS